MLINIRSTSTNDDLSEKALKGPSKELILQVTENLPIRNPPKHIPSLYCPADVNK